MKRFLTISLMLFCVLIAEAQSISVSSFKLLENDLDANTTGTMERDQNGEAAALIKVVTTQTGFSFDGGALGIVKTVPKPGEIWVYVPRGLKKISISHPQLGILRDYYLPIGVASARTYEMVLVTGAVETSVRQVRTSQYVVFQLTPPNAVVELDGELLQTNGGTATKMKKFGSYNYRVKAPNYLPEAGNVTVNDPNNKHLINVALKPNFSPVTLKVDGDAEIWVNGERKGRGYWAGNLGVGTYIFEAKKENHRDSYISHDITVTTEPQTITLQAPTPILGEADINSSPAMADIYIDGKKVGQTPQLITDLLIGEHQYRLSRHGYTDYNGTMVIREGETAQISATLANANKMPVVSTSLNATTSMENAQKAELFVQSNQEYFRSLSPEKQESVKNAYNMGIELVDLGLSVRWANMNVGATKPEEKGGLFSWGEVEPNSDRVDKDYHPLVPNWEDYLDKNSDPATVKWGPGFHTPTVEQWKELKKKCKRKVNEDLNCVTFTGPNGNSIIIPFHTYWSNERHKCWQITNYRPASMFTIAQSCLLIRPVME